MRTIINIDVPALAPAINFYCAALPLRHTRTLDDDVAELSGTSSLIYLLQKAEHSPSASPGSEPRRFYRHWTPVHVDFVVDDVEAAAERAEKAGAVRETGCVRWRGSKCITFSDPFGHGFCLIEFEQGAYAD